MGASGLELTLVRRATGGWGEAWASCGVWGVGVGLKGFSVHCPPPKCRSPCFAALHRCPVPQVSVYSFATEKRVKLLPMPLAATVTPAAAVAAATGGPHGGAGGGGSTGGGAGSSRGGTENGALGGAAPCVRVECLHFSENSKFLLTQYAEPDWVLVVWRWYSGKVKRAGPPCTGSKVNDTRSTAARGLVAICY